ncbi:MAG: hypothetical protein GY941_19885 [Planctomycetes bacterium]|nr:hypothetical protein [Planctomycetota bacterium]
MIYEKQVSDEETVQATVINTPTGTYDANAPDAVAPDGWTLESGDAEPDDFNFIRGYAVRSRRHLRRKLINDYGLAGADVGGVVALCARMLGVEKVE